MKTEKYTEQQKRLPQTGKQIIARREEDNTIVVYQAFNSAIADYAVKTQKFGGSHYNFNRMSWIKPGFLWMMHRAGWATKINQERILAIHLPLQHFKIILQEATISSFKEKLFATRELWKQELAKTNVRLQWDPDHDPYGNKQERKAIQLGMKGALLEEFCTKWITKIEDVTNFVQQQQQKVVTGNLHELIVPFEEVINLQDAVIEKRIGVDK